MIYIHHNIYERATSLNLLNSNKIWRKPQVLKAFFFFFFLRVVLKAFEPCINSNGNVNFIYNLDEGSKGSCCFIAYIAVDIYCNLHCVCVCVNSKDSILL